jgi:branched-chain amino acid transport system substrate-binding protein
MAKEKKEIVIGAPIPVTGPFAALGKEQKWAYEKAVSDINKEGGIFVKEYGKKLPVKLIVADAESNPGKAVTAFEKLVKVDKVDLMLSSQVLPLVLPTAAAAEKLKIYYHATTCSSVMFRKENFKYSTLYFVEDAEIADSPYLVLNSIPENVRPKKLALLSEEGADGKIFAPFFRNGAKKFGYSFAADESYTSGAKDYSGLVLKLIGKGVDSALIIASPSDTITLMRQAKELDLDLKYAHGFKGTWGIEFWNAMGKDANYVLADGFWNKDFPFPYCKELGEAYKKEFGKHSVFIGLFYALSQTLFEAIETAGTLDDLKVRDAVLRTEFKGTTMGDIKYKADGTASVAPAAFQWWDGDLKQVLPIVQGSWKVKLAPSWEKR